MKYAYCISIIMMCLVTSCSNRKHPTEPYSTGTSEYMITKEDTETDTITMNPASQQPSENNSASSYNSGKSKELDNMRGFDPASEDDMDDNGMQRYFDANDEEAWD